MTPGYSLRWRLTLVMLLMFVLGLGAASAFSLYELDRNERGERVRLLREQAHELLASTQRTVDGRMTVALPSALDELYRGSAPGFAFTLYDASRQPVARSPNLAEPLSFLQAPATGLFGRLQTLDRDGRAAIAVRAPRDHTLVVARGRLEQRRLATIFLYELYEFGSVFIAFAIASLGLIWLVSGWSLRPLERASREAANIGPRNLSGRISAEGLPREVRSLVDAVNSTLAQLDHAYGVQRRLTADAAHELRTPLAVLSLRLQRARLESAVDWSAIEGDLAQMSRLVTQLLELARKESSATTHNHAHLRTINLSRIVREATAMVLPLTETDGRMIEVEASDVFPVHGHADDLRDAVRNLLDNALVHGQGTIRISVREETDATGRRALIEVTDDGRGIPDELRELVFERFRKAVATSPGAGLGLAIVRHVARTHGGDAKVGPGPGGHVQISLPMSA